MARSTVKSAQRVFEVLEFFDAVRKPLSLKQICDQFNYPVSSAAAILKSLIELGYLELDKRSRTYLPTMRIAVLGRWVEQELFGERNILEKMERLRDLTGETIVLATLSDLYVQYAHVVNSQQKLRYKIEPGEKRPLTQSGFGALLLSDLNNEDADLLIRRANAASSNYKEKVSSKTLLREIDRIRQTGFIASQSTISIEVGVLGVLLPRTRYGRRYAIGIGGPWKRLKPLQENLIALLFEFAENIAQIDETAGIQLNT